LSGDDAESVHTRQHIEEGYLQAERGELIDGEEVQREIQAKKATWQKPMFSRSGLSYR
jgi:predicted transcriptional regulator